MPDERDHDLGDRVAAAFLTAIWALRMARVWTLTKSGNISPSRSAQPEHGVLLVQRLDGPEELLVLLGRAARGFAGSP